MWIKLTHGLQSDFLYFNRAFGFFNILVIIIDKKIGKQLIREKKMQILSDTFNNINIKTNKKLKYQKVQIFEQITKFPPHS